jgi:N-methylhydantoinase B/acetone carboxylase alpha subunit
MAKLITASPVALLSGELLFMIANPEGDCVAASYGLAGHVQAFPYVIQSIAELGFEDDPEIREGDIFATNDALYGAPHNADNYTWVPVFYKGELIAWMVGLNHITDVGAIQPGNTSMVSPNTFTDGFVYPPTKTGENFKQHKWWELYWQRRTRTGKLNTLDDKMRVAGAVMLHDRVLEIVEEFGVDYFRKALREILERERRALLQRIKAQAIPGVYHFLYLNSVMYKGMLGELFATSNRNWLLHQPAEFQILSDGQMFIDLEGLTSEADFHCNDYESSIRAMSLLGAWPMFAYTKAINTSLKYVTDFNIPLGSMLNPENEFAATTMGIAPASQYCFAFLNCLSYAYFARGFLEECFPQEPGAIAYGLDGVLGDGFRWAGGELSLVDCMSSNAVPYKDGDIGSWCAANPMSDLGETELSEFMQPTNLNIGIKPIPDYCGHGKFRGGLGIGMCQLIVDPGESLTVAAFASTGGIGRLATGMAGGYPGLNDIIYFAHNTNMREILAEGLPYPTDFVELREWLKKGKLEAGSVEVYTRPSPNVECKDGDIFACASSARGGWGDPLEREFSLVENDVCYGWLTPDVARTVYGVVTDEEGRVKVAESNELRQQMRNRRKQRSVDAGEWWRKEREKVLTKEFPEDVHNMFADILKYDKFRHQFMEMWQLPEEYEL